MAEMMSDIPKREVDEVAEQEDADVNKPKKQKFSRSRTACLPCRSRKSRCGALPPDPCPNCVEAKLECSWPQEDGRSSKARMLRAKGPSGTEGGGVGQGRRKSSGAGNGSFGMMDMGTSWGAGPSRIPQYAPSQPIPDLAGPVQMPLDPRLLSGQSYDYQQTMPTYQPMSMSMGMPQMASSSTDPSNFMWALSSQLPLIEETSPPNGPASTSQTSSGHPTSQWMEKEKTSDGKVVKISWFRPHGQTAYAPGALGHDVADAGLKRITLKVRIDTPAEALQRTSPNAAGSANVGQDLFMADGTPEPSIMKHLLDLFMLHFGCQFPSIDKEDMISKIDAKEGNVFLLDCIAGVAARFSTHPAIALPSLEPWAYGNVFYHRAKAMLGSMLSVPSRDAVLGFMLLAHMSFANDVESEIWMLTGMAVRMALDMGLHLNPPADSHISAEDQRLNRLVFYSVLILDCSLAFGVGRQTALRADDITQPLVSEDDMRSSELGSGSSSRQDSLQQDDANTRSVFPFAAKLMHSYCPLINMLNRQDHAPTAHEAEINEARMGAIRLYNQLPQDMQWNVGNLQRHCKASQGPIFVSMHLWMHTILASGYLTGTNLLRRSPSIKRYPSGHIAPLTNLTSIGASAGNGLGAPPSSDGGPLLPGTATPSSASITSLWRNSARTIGDILVLSEIISPTSYLALPFAVQPFYVASCCYVKEIEQTKSQIPSPSVSPRRNPANLPNTNSTGNDSSSKQLELSRALLTSVATTNITTLQNGLSKQATYWSGVRWILGALEKRIEGFQTQDVDLAAVTEKLKSLITLPDAGILGRRREAEGNGAVAELENAQTLGEAANAMGMGFGDDSGFGTFGDFDFLSTFDLGNPEGAQGVTEMDVSLPDAWQMDWFRS